MKPMTRPTTGMTKNPITAPTPPTTSTQFGTPLAFICLPGIKYLSNCPTAMIAIAPMAIAHAVVPPVRTAHTMIAPATSRAPGRIGTMVPASPTRIASATRRLVMDTG